MKKVLCLIAILVVLVACFMPSMAFADNQEHDYPFTNVILSPIFDWSDSFYDYRVYLEIRQFSSCGFNMHTLDSAYSARYDQSLWQYLDDCYGFVVAFELRDASTSGFVNACIFQQMFNLPEYTGQYNCRVMGFDSSDFFYETFEEYEGLSIGEILDCGGYFGVNRPADFSGCYNFDGLAFIVFEFTSFYGGMNVDYYFEDYDFPFCAFGSPESISYALYTLGGDYDLGFSAGKAQADSQKYNQGYNAGVAFADGRNNTNSVSYGYGYADGITDADNRNNPYSVSYNQGRLAGLRESEEYSFMGLVSAVVDAPIQAGLNLFNFEILGVNMRGIYTALFTACVVIIVVKFVLAK